MVRSKLFYLLSLKSAGEFSHKMNKPMLEFITAVKSLIECCIGYDMITGKDLSDFERGMKAVSGIVSLFTLGKDSLVMNRGKIALGETVKMGAKILAIDVISTGVSYVASEICQAMGCSGGLTLVLSLLTGMGTSGGLGNKVLGSGGLGKVDVIAALNKVDYDEVLKLRKGSEGVENGPEALSTPSFRILRKNLINAGIEVPNYPNAAHHIVAGNFPKVAEAREILGKHKVGINCTFGGTFLPTAKNVSQRAYHPSLHTSSYYDTVNKLLNTVTSKEDTLDILDYIREELENGIFMK